MGCLHDRSRGDVQASRPVQARSATQAAPARSLRRGSEPKRLESRNARRTPNFLRNAPEGTRRKSVDLRSRPSALAHGTLSLAEARECARACSTHHKLRPKAKRGMRQAHCQPTAMSPKERRCRRRTAGQHLPTSLQRPALLRRAYGRRTGVGWAPGAKHVLVVSFVPRERGAKFDFRAQTWSGLV